MRGLAVVESALAIGSAWVPAWVPAFMSTLVSTAALVTVAPCAFAQGALPPAAASCTACHGAKGVAAIPETPHLAGQPPGYLTAQLKAYREGTRKHEVMNVAAKTLSDADIDAIVRWFSQVQIEAK